MGVKVDSERVLVTGGSGFIGQVLCRRLREAGYFVIATGRRAEMGGPWHHFVQWDCSTGAGALREAMTDVRIVFHLAGQAHVGGSSRAEMLGVNFGGTRCVYEEATRAAVQRFVFFSSVKAAGPPGNHQVDEGHGTAPETPYGESKRAAENFLLRRTDQRGPSVAVLRPTLVYGAGWKGNLAKLQRAMRWRMFPDIGVGDNRRSMVAIDDVAAAAVKTGRCNVEGVFILTDGETYSTERIFQAVRKGMNCKPALVRIPGGPVRAILRVARAALSLGLPVGELVAASERLTESAWYDCSRAKRELGWTPQLTFEDFVVQLQAQV